MRKFNEVEFKPKPLVLEEAKPKYVTRTQDKQSSSHDQFTNYYSNIKHQHEQQQEEHQHHQEEERQKQQEGQQQEQYQQQHKQQSNNNQK